MSTPLMKQYWEIKAQYPDSILFFRMGDFYELFGQDAIDSAKILGITLTKRNNGKAGQVELCGFPYHAAERYIPKMIRAGKKVAVCEQVEDPKEAKGLVKRDVIEVITAGTTLSESTLDEGEKSWLAAVYPIPGMNDPRCALALLDITTGEFICSEGSEEDVENELYRQLPREILIPDQKNLPDFIKNLEEIEKLPLTRRHLTQFNPQEAHALLCRQFHSENLYAYGIEELPNCQAVSGAVLEYALEQKKAELDHLDRIQYRSMSSYMTLDPQTMRNLELLKPLNSEDEKSTLISILDYTRTAMGSRKLKDWVGHPLLDRVILERRQDAVEELLNAPIISEDLKLALREISDLERLMGRVGTGRANGRDLLALGKSLRQAANLGHILRQTESQLFENLVAAPEELESVADRIMNAIVDEPPLTLREGGVIRPGASTELDALNEGIRDAREWLSGLESRERERLGVSSLKIRFNKVFGYYLEVPKMHQDKVPEEYIRKQTLANAERYISPEMKEYEARILNAEGEINSLEYKLFGELRESIHKESANIRQTADEIAQIDCIYSLSVAAHKHSLQRPKLYSDRRLVIHNAFHPVIKANNPDMDFIRNDVGMDPEKLQIMLITGPNMAGKSTYLRQTGLVVLLAQIGSFVPADSADIGIVDRIFTRVGASDRLSRGQSTFMVEMVETANILQNATPDSLILLDEIGRGTSTFDGLSLAWSIVEYLHKNEDRAGKTLFATHYHELTVLDEELDRLGNYHITVKEKNGHLLFLRKIVKGACDSSYGIQVARMAGVPKEVIVRAQKLLLRLEDGRVHPLEQESMVAETQQQDLFSPSAMPEEEILAIEELRKADPNQLTPMQALQFLVDLKEHYLK